MRKLIFLFSYLFIVGISMVLAQTSITGKILSAEDGDPVIGATIMVKGTTTGTITDMNGDFTISLSESERTLVISYIGMKTVEVQASPNMTILMESDTAELEEVMVIAYGTAKKSAFTGSAKVVDSERIEQSQVTSVVNALAGAVPGVQLTSDSGAPGSTSSIKVRGFSSLNAGNDPLVIVDGAPYSGDLANINPSDVESMTVLKDAASNALYGARGANGVIIVTTKQASRAKDAVITFDAKYGFNTRALQQYNIITDPAHYYETHYGALSSFYINQGNNEIQAWIRANQDIFKGAGDGGLGYNVYTIPENQMFIGFNGKVNPNATLGRVQSYRGVDYYLKPDDWADVGTRVGNRQEYNLSISGADAKSTYYASLGYLNNQGVTMASDLQRINARLRADYQAKDWMKVGATMAYTRFDSNSLGNNGASNSTANIWAFTSQMAPIYPAYIRDASGDVMRDSDNFQMMDYGDSKNAGLVRPFITNANPIMDSQLNTRNAEGNATMGNAYADFTFYPGLVITVNGTYNLDEQRSTYVYNPFYGQFDSSGGTVSKAHRRIYDYNLQQLINYTTRIGMNNNINILLGHEYYNYLYANLSATKSKMFSQDNKELGGAVIDGQNADSYKDRRNNEGYFSRVQYDYDNRIFASASYRRDASSRFHPDHRWGNFWSVGSAWILSREDWFDVSWIDELKVKASYGVQGNDNIGLYRYTDVFNIENSAGNIGTSFETKGSQDITWETNGNLNVGTEFQLFNRITGSLEYYYRKTTDMLFSFSVAPSLGYSSYYDNIGDMYNTGLELELGANIIDTRDFSWDVNFNLSTLKNRITMLHDDKKTSSLYDADGNEYKGYNSGSFFIAEDVSIYTWRLKEYAGVSDKGESLWYKNVKDDEGNITGRETTTEYSEGDYFVTNETSLPKLFGGFGTTFRVQNWDLSANFTYQIGGKQYDGTYASFMSPPISSNTGYNFHVDVLDAWTPENSDSNIPRFMFDDVYGAGTSTRFLTNASYLNIQNINLGYNLPTKWTSNITSMRLYLSAENVFYWSKRKGFDPRQSFSETTNATHYSPMRTISGGITLNF